LAIRHRGGQRHERISPRRLEARHPLTDLPLQCQANDETPPLPNATILDHGIA